MLPLLGSVVFVAGLIGMQRAQLHVSMTTTIFLNNICTAFAFSFFWLLGGTIPNVDLWYQPVLLAILFIAGLILTFAAVRLGDVSVATPVLGLKVIIVAALMTIWLGQIPSGWIWLAATLAAIGIGLIQWTDRGHPKRLWGTIVMAISAATCYAHFDIAVQQWAPNWGTGRLMPLIAWCIGLFSLPLARWVQWSAIGQPSVRGWLLVGCVATTAQACLIISTLATFGDAARVNVVFSLRGLWGLIMAVFVARIWGGHEAELTARTLWMRYGGAVLLTSAVIIAVAFG
ncbi:MAG: DMT family transporter [Planctomycetota bacterium]